MAPTARQIDTREEPFKRQNHVYPKRQACSKPWNNIFDNGDMLHETTVRQLHGKT